MGTGRHHQAVEQARNPRQSTLKGNIMGKFNEIASGKATETVLRLAVQPETSQGKSSLVVSRVRDTANRNTKKRGRNYTTEERRRGAIKCASVKRDRAYSAIDRELSWYVKSEELQCIFVYNHRFILIEFCKTALPWMKPEWARRQYGAYIKARLKFFEGKLPVFNLAILVNKIRDGMAKKAGKPVPAGMFESMKGWVHRLSSNPFKTSYRHIGAEWLNRMGIWAQWIDCETGEVL